MVINTRRDPGPCSRCLRATTDEVVDGPLDGHGLCAWCQSELLDEVTQGTWLAQFGRKVLLTVAKRTKKRSGQPSDVRRTRRARG